HKGSACEDGVADDHESIDVPVGKWVPRLQRAGGNIECRKPPARLAGNRGEGPTEVKQAGFVRRERDHQVVGIRSPGSGSPGFERDCPDIRTGFAGESGKPTPEEEVRPQRKHRSDRAVGGGGPFESSSSLPIEGCHVCAWLVADLVEFTPDESGSAPRFPA